MSSVQSCAAAMVASAGVVMAFATPGLAADGPYFGLYGGANFVEDSDVEGGGEAELDTGGVFGGVLGYSHSLDRMGLDNINFRPELDLGYRTNQLDSLSGNGAGAGSGNLDGDFNTFHAMANTWFDYELGRFKPYVGGGLGVAVVSLDDAQFNNTSIPDDEDTVFAYQAGAGVAYQLMRQWEVSVDYRFFETEDPTFNAAGGGGDFETENRNHSVLATLRYSF